MPAAYRQQYNVMTLPSTSSLTYWPASRQPALLTNHHLNVSWHAVAAMAYYCVARIVAMSRNVTAVSLFFVANQQRQPRSRSRALHRYAMAVSSYVWRQWRVAQRLCHTTYCGVAMWRRSAASAMKACGLYRPAIAGHGGNNVNGRNASRVMASHRQWPA